MDILSSSRLMFWLMILGLVAAYPAQGELLFRMHGSNTVGAALGPALAKHYLRKELGAGNVHYRPDSVPRQGWIVGELPDGRGEVAIEIHAHGSSTAFRDLRAGLADVGMASRPIKAKEVTALKPLGSFTGPQAEYVIGLDGIAVIVPRNNRIKSLTVAQLAAVFSGRIRSWRELGINMGRIAVYARDDNSGTYDTFKHLVLGKKLKLTGSARRYESNAELSDDVSRDPQAIGFVGLPYIRNSRAVTIAVTKGAARYPSVFNVATEDYALSRRLFMYAAPRTQNRDVEKFLAFALSDSGQKVVRQTGFVSQNIEALDMQVSKVYPREYRDFVKNARRLSVNFRFKKGSLELDSRAYRDLERVAKYIQQHPEVNELMLFGFSEDASIPIHNISLSEARADKVENELRKRGITVHHIRGYGAYGSVADNKEKEKNRRVEVWVR